MTKIKKVVIAILIYFLPLLLSADYIYAGGEAMFGLKWGMSPRQVREIGVSLKKSEHIRRLQSYTTSSLPKNIPDIRSYILKFADNKSLVKIIMMGELITNDAYGIEGKKRFGDLDSILSKKYKLDKEFTKVGSKVFRDSDEFYECLKHKGCGMWIKLYSGKNKNIVLKIIGLGRGAGFVELTVEAAPGLEDYINKLKSYEKKDMEKAL